MSESEQTGRCRMEMTAAYAAKSFKPNDSDEVIADAIDRLAADVAAVMEMTQEIALRVPSEFGQDACDAAVRVALKERDAAVRERDEARAIAADVAAVKAKVDAVSPEDVAHFVDSEKAWVAMVEEQRDSAIRERDQWREEARLAVVNRDEARAEVERLRAELAAPQPAAPPAGWLTERERRAVAYFAQVCRDDLVPDEWTDSAGVLRSFLARAGSPPEQAAPWWLTDEERRALSRAVHLLFDDDCDTPSARTIQALLARAGSPPVVDVPELPSNHYARSEAERYRAAIDKAGVAWKEVGRE